MNEIKLSKRLKMVAGFVAPQARVADIGSDHAYLPTYLVQSGQINFALAGEVVKGPFEIAQNQVNEMNLQQQIEVRLANGLAAIELTDQIDTIVIAGMGGILISEILDAGQEKLAPVKRLILQPNNHEDSLRQWLFDHHFMIKNEAILLEAGKFYEIIVAEPAEISVSKISVPSAKSLMFGPILSEEKSEVFQQKWQKELTTLHKILERLPEEQKEKRQQILHQISEITEAIQ